MVAAVYEDVLLGSVAVQVHERGDLALAAHALHERLGVEDNGVQRAVRGLPRAVEVAAGEAGTVGAEDAVRLSMGTTLKTKA